MNNKVQIRKETMTKILVHKLKMMYSREDYAAVWRQLIGEIEVSDHLEPEFYVDAADLVKNNLIGHILDMLEGEQMDPLEKRVTDIEDALANLGENTRFVY